MISDPKVFTSSKHPKLSINHGDFHCSHHQSSLIRELFHEIQLKSLQTPVSATDIFYNCFIV